MEILSGNVLINNMDLLAWSVAYKSLLLAIGCVMDVVERLLSPV